MAKEKFAMPVAIEANTDMTGCIHIHITTELIPNVSGNHIGSIHYSKYAKVWSVYYRPFEGRHDQSIWLYEYTTREAAEQAFIKKVNETWQPIINIYHDIIEEAYAVNGTK